MSDLVSVGALVFQAGIAVLLVVSVRRNETAAAINCAVALLASLSPTLLSVVLEFTGTGTVTVDPILPLWLGVAGFLHAIGMLGAYETVWWWDHITHTVSAALVAALVAAALVFVGSSGTTVAVVTVLTTLGLGIVWEVIELLARALGDRYGVEPVLVHYGIRDTVFDLVFDIVGAALVILLDVRVFVPVIEELVRAIS